MRTSVWLGRSKWCAAIGGLVIVGVLATVLGWALPVSANTAPAVTPPSQPTIAAGLFLTAAVKADGSLWIWGEHFPDHVAGRPVPTRVDHDNDWTGVSADLSGVIALRSDNSLWAVGFPDADGSEEAGSTDLTTVVRIGSTSDWRSVSGGQFFALALKCDGSLWVLETDWDTATRSFTRIGTDADWTTVSVAGAYSFAIKSDGSLWSIIRSEESVDDEDPENFETTVSYSVSRIGGDDEWATVSGNANSAVAVKTDGSLWSIGYHDEYSIDPVTDELTWHDSQTIERIGVDSDWATAVTSGQHWLAIKSDGTLWTWGSNTSGQLGDGTTDDRDEPARLGTSNKWRAVATYSSCSVAIKADGTLWTWGRNQTGQVGNGTSTDQHSPVKVVDGVKVPAWPGESPSFSDISGSPYEAAIRDLAGRDVISGFDDGSFRPDTSVSRQQFAKMIARALALPVTGAEICPFSDVAVQVGNDPLYPSKYVTVCAQRGITQGKTATTFSPESGITHEQLITMAVRAAALPDPPVDFLPSFSSSQFSLEQHFRNARKAAYAHLLDGLQGLGRSFAFGAASTRGECAQILFNLLAIIES